MTKVALTGRMGAGKTTFADMLVWKACPSYARILKFAQPIYDVLKVFHREQKHRAFMQAMGDIARMHLGDEIFMELFMSAYYEALQESAVFPTALILCDDCRFRQEYDLLKELGFLVVKLECDDIVRRERIATWGSAKHRSEKEVDTIPADITIYNTGPVGALERETLTVIKAYKDLNFTGKKND